MELKVIIKTSCKKLRHYNKALLYPKLRYKPYNTEKIKEQKWHT